MSVFIVEYLALADSAQGHVTSATMMQWHLKVTFIIDAIERLGKPRLNKVEG